MSPVKNGQRIGIMSPSASSTSSTSASSSSAAAAASSSTLSHFWFPINNLEGCINTLVNVYVDLLVFTRIAGT